MPVITVFTNGCFDLLHVGHVRLLRFARSQGDRLVVGLNSDESVRRLKGPARPIVPVDERRELLLALKSVDQVIIFHEDTPLTLIDALRPDILVKGPDYAHHECCGAQHVASYGGRVVIPDWPIEHSSTQVVERIVHSKGTAGPRVRGVRSSLQNSYGNAPKPLVRHLRRDAFVRSFACQRTAIPGAALVES